MFETSRGPWPEAKSSCTVLKIRHGFQRIIHPWCGPILCQQFIYVFFFYFNLYLHKSSTNFRSISNPICLRSSSTISWFGVEAKVSLGWVILLWSSILPFLLNSAGHSGHLTLYWICQNEIWVLSSSLRVVANSHFLHLKMLLTTYIFPLLLPISTSVYVCTLWNSVIN